MRRIDFKVPIYDWEVTVVTVYDKSDMEPMRALLQEIDACEADAKETLKAIEINGINGGDTYNDGEHRKSLIIIYPWSSKEKFYEVLNHEKRHLVDRMLQWSRISDFEAAAYLDGYISRQIFSRLKELVL